MPLSEHEQRLLEQMEQQLSVEDPKFASAMRGSAARVKARRRIILGALGVLVGLGLVLLGVAAGSRRRRHRRLRRDGGRRLAGRHPGPSQGPGRARSPPTARPSRTRPKGSGRGQAPRSRAKGPARRRGRPGSGSFMPGSSSAGSAAAAAAGTPSLTSDLLRASTIARPADAVTRATPTSQVSAIARPAPSSISMLQPGRGQRVPGRPPGRLVAAQAAAARPGRRRARSRSAARRTGITKKPTSPSTPPTAVLDQGTPACRSRRPGTTYFTTVPTTNSAVATARTTQARSLPTSAPRPAIAPEHQEQAGQHRHQDADQPDGDGQPDQGTRHQRSRPSDGPRQDEPRPGDQAQDDTSRAPAAAGALAS